MLSGRPPHAHSGDSVATPSCCFRGGGRIFGRAGRRIFPNAAAGPRREARHAGFGDVEQMRPPGGRLPAAPCRRRSPRPARPPGWRAGARKIGLDDPALEAAAPLRTQLQHIFVIIAASSSRLTSSPAPSSAAPGSGPGRRPGRTGGARSAFARRRGRRRDAAGPFPRRSPSLAPRRRRSLPSPPPCSSRSAPTALLPTAFAARSASRHRERRDEGALALRAPAVDALDLERPPARNRAGRRTGEIAFAGNAPGPALVADDGGMAAIELCPRKTGTKSRTTSKLQGPSRE